jgi:CRP-like cAMP-binding protein
MSTPSVVASGEQASRSGQHNERNRLLRALSPESYARLTSSMDAITLALGEVLYEANAPIKHAYFIQRGVASLVAPVDQGERGWERVVEVGTIGNEGMVGLPLALGTDREPVRAFIQVPDGAWRIRASDLIRALDEVDGLRSLVLRYAQTFMSQIGQGSACNRAHTIGERCARWLLMTHDRVGEDEFTLTHEFLAAMLGVRRAGVTVAAGMLQKAGLIRYARGNITVIDRVGLEAASCPCYATIRDSYEQLLGDGAAV